MDPVYLWVRGVAVELQPPAGFYPDENLVGFYNDSLMAAIAFSVLPMNFEDYKKHKGMRFFELSGIKLFERQELTLDGKNALFVHSEYPYPAFANHHLRLGIQHGVQTLLVEAVCSTTTKSEGLEDYLKQSLFSLKHLENREENQFPRLGYEFELSDSPLNLTGVCGMTSFYETSVDSLKMDDAKVMVRPYDYPFEREDTSVFIQEMIQSRAETKEVEIRTMDKKVLNGKNVWTATAINLLPGCQDNLYFEGYFFLKESFYRISGSSFQQPAFWLEEFQKVMESFKIR